jgi:hypothetical protein
MNAQEFEGFYKTFFSLSQPVRDQVVLEIYNRPVSQERSNLIKAITTCMLFDPDLTQRQINRDRFIKLEEAAE